MSEPKRNKIGDQEASPVYTESEYQALKKENDLLKQAHEDISQLLDTGKWSDVTISVCGNNFAAHRNILSARSSTFANLLEQNHKENCLVISDLPVGVFEVLLNFIYTGKVPSLEPQMAEDLLTAADKYRLEKLKSLAEDYLELTSSHATSSATPPLAHLPDLCLLALFRQLPPADQMSARKTCHRWSVLVPVANQPHVRFLTIVFNRSLDNAEYRLSHPTHGRHWELWKLLKKEDGSPLVSIRPLTKWNSLEFSTLDEETISQIMATFPVVRELQLFADMTINKVHCDCCTVTTHPPDLLVRLLEPWHHQLTNLSMEVQIQCPFEHHLRPSLDRLATAINSLPTLKHLTINLSLNHKSFLPDLPVLSQLTQFNTWSLDFLEILPQYVPPLNFTLTQISCGSNKETAIQLASLNKDLRRRIVRFGNLQTDYQMVCNLLPSLTSVWLKLSNGTTFRHLLLHASQLTQLVQLQLSVDFPRMHPDDQPHHPLPQLTSVKLLHLFLFNSMQSHADLESLNFPWTMPNLQVIDLEIYPKLKCTICDFANAFEDENKTKHCLRQIFAHLKRACAQLHTIKHNREDRLGTAEEILNG